MAAVTHTFDAVAFAENFKLEELKSLFPGATGTPHEAGTTATVAEGLLTIDQLTPERASVVALTVAQSVAMEYYEGIVESMFERTEVLSVLHLLDKPDEAWDDPTMDRIYAQLRAEFDLIDRYTALESKLRSVQEALQLVLDVARDRRLVLLEASIVALERSAAVADSRR